MKQSVFKLGCKKNCNLAIVLNINACVCEIGKPVFFLKVTFYRPKSMFYIIMIIYSIHPSIRYC